jgi:peptidoglycan hydrolase-like protein with peptidoglycan-binding domain
MKHSLTAVIAIATAAGFAGMAQAQTTTAPAGTAPQSVQTTAPATQAPANTAATSPSAAPANPNMAAPQAGMQQPAGGDSFWSRRISQDDVRQTQQQLKAQGLYNGPADGLVGPEMQRALARYQQQNGLRQTGTLDEQTSARLSSNTGPVMGANTAPAAGPAPATGMTAAPAPTAPTAGASTAPAGTTAPIGAGGTTSAPTPPNTQPPNR